MARPPLALLLPRPLLVALPAFRPRALALLLALGAMLACAAPMLLRAQDDGAATGNTPAPAADAPSEPRPSPLPGTSLEEERAALVRARAQAEEARKRSERLEARAASAAAAADKARDQAAALAARIQQSEADLRAGAARIAIIARLQRQQARRLAARQQPIVRLTASLQQLARRAPVIALLEPGTVRDAVHRRIVLARVLPEIMRKTRGLRAEVNRSAELRRVAEVANATVRQTRDGLTGQRKALAVLEQRQRIASRDYQANARLETERALAMGEAAHDIGDLMARIEVAADVRDALMALPGPTPRPAAPGGAALPGDVAAPIAGDATPAYALPVIGDVVTGFGEISPQGITSRGLTIAVAPAATVVAPAAGRVAFAGPFRGYGQILILDHGGGWTTLIANLASLSAQVGDSVRQGDPLGAAGDDKPRITIELRRDDRPVDIAAMAR